jgi:hypothetical protein
MLGRLPEPPRKKTYVKQRKQNRRRPRRLKVGISQDCGFCIATAATAAAAADAAADAACSRAKHVAFARRVCVL